MKTTFAQRKFLAAVGAVAVAVVTPALLFAGAGTAQADDVCTPAYSQGYSDGVFGGPGQCFLDPTKQSQYDSGFSDGSAGRPSNPPSPWPTISLPNPGDTPQSTMSPWDGSQGSWPEPPEFPEYHEPGEPYEPTEQPWEEMEPPLIP